jgi:hypothetical protein
MTDKLFRKKVNREKTVKKKEKGFSLSIDFLVDCLQEPFLD